jgi:AcrR family transcriptional regulator
MPRKKSLHSSLRPRTGNQRNLALHQAILYAASAVLQEKGPSGFTIEAVAKKAECGKPTIYRWWPNRTVLLIEVYEQLVAKELYFPNSLDLAEDISGMIKLIWRAWRKNSYGSLFRSILAESIQDEEGMRRLREDFFPARQARSSIAFRAAKERGEIPQNVDTGLLLDLLYGYSLFCLMTDRIEDESVADLVGVILAFIAKNPMTSHKRLRRNSSSRWA